MHLLHHCWRYWIHILLSFPKKLVDKENITHKGLIAKPFNTYFARIGTNLAKTIEISIKFEFSVIELKDPFFKYKTNKSSGYDDISFNVIRNCFGALLKPLIHIFNLSVEKGIFPDDLKIARVIPIFKAGDESEIGNYRPISVLSCFSKILERIMYNRIFRYLTAN